MGLEPTTFCMASRRSSQLSYIRSPSEYRGGIASKGRSRLPLTLPHRGDVAEWLRGGLQSPSHRFDSGRRLWNPVICLGANDGSAEGATDAYPGTEQAP